MRWPSRRLGLANIGPAADTLVHGKGGHERLLPITAEARAVLVQYLGEHPEAASGPLVRSHSDYRRGVSADLVSRIVGEAMKAAGVKLVKGDGASAHALRHSFATDLVHGGAPLPIIQRALGHASLRTTGRYVTASATELRDALEGRRYDPPPETPP